MSARLPADVWRCHDRTCPDREGCRRWLDRLSGTDRTIHTYSLRDDPALPCAHRLPINLLPTVP